MPHCNISIKTATYEDLPAVADIQVRSWQQAYIGQIEQSYLDSLDKTARLEKWREGFLKNGHDPQYGVLIACIDEQPAGFLSFGPARDERIANHTEIYAVYALREYWSQGVGYRLFQEACGIFKARGSKHAYLWVLDTNQRAIQSYRRWGGKLQSDITKDHVIGSQSVTEACVIFDI